VDFVPQGASAPLQRDKEGNMPTYIALAKFTDQGIRSVRQTVQRADASREVASRFGVKITSIHWVQGQYDVVTVCEAEDEQAISAFGLAVAAGGNVKFETLRAFTREEMAQIVAKVP
jgi:uncharacterized protein with GYD domain